MVEVAIRQVGNGASVSDWISVPALVHSDDPHFVRQLDLNERMRVSRWFSPFFGHGEAALFVARKNGRLVGRISAQINQLDRQYRDPASGHFGFFDCIDDPAVSSALFTAARNWLADRGATSIAGPFSLSINEETGVLVDGFDERAAVLTNQARPYTAGLIEQAGLAKAMDLLAFRMRVDTDIPALDRIARSALSIPNLVIRPVNVKRFDDEVMLLADIFNDAWRGNWGFLPMARAEIKAMSRELKPFFAAEYGCFVEVDGQAVAVLMAIPDVNSVIGPFNGRLLPFNIVRLFRRLRNRQFTSARIPLMGIRQAYQGTPAASAILALMVSRFLHEARHYDLEWAEFSWVLETNRPMLALARMIAGEPARRYRVYSAPLHPATQPAQPNG